MTHFNVSSLSRLNYSLQMQKNSANPEFLKLEEVKINMKCSALQTIKCADVETNLISLYRTSSPNVPMLYSRSRDIQNKTNSTNNKNGDEDRKLSDSEDSDEKLHDKHYMVSKAPVYVGRNCAFRGRAIVDQLPAIGVFWDIENCQVPKGRSAAFIAHAIREKFFAGHREGEFLVVCDVRKENSIVLQELDDAQVNLLHVNSQRKNTADDKLKYAMRRFAETHPPPVTIILISGDINFSTEINDLRHRKKAHVILLHNDLCSDALIQLANEHYNYMSMVEVIPLRGFDYVNANVPVEIMVSNLPAGQDPSKVRNKLKRLSENSGGRVGIIINHEVAIRFSNMEYALRARKRMSQERVFGNLVHLSLPYQVTPAATSPLELSPSPNRRPYWRPNGEMYNFHNATSSYEGQSFSYNESNIGCFRTQGSHFQNVHKNNGFRSYNQENGNDSINYPPWFWNSPKKPNCGLNEIQNPRPILASCDGNIKNPSENDQDDEKCVIPPVTILKRGDCPPLKFSEIGKENEAVIRSIGKKNLLRDEAIVSRNSSSVSNNHAGNKYFNHVMSSGKYSMAASSSTPCLSVPQSQQQPPPVELHVTNLDQSLDRDMLTNLLSDAFMDHVVISYLSVFQQSDGNFAATVRVPSMDTAKHAIRHMQHKRIGNKRICIDYAHSGSPHNSAILKMQVISLLSNVPGFQLPLFTFREMFEKRCNTPLSTSDLYKMRDACVVTEDSSGRTISLHWDHRPSCRSALSLSPESPYVSTILLPEQHLCHKHGNRFKRGVQGGAAGWAELEVCTLPSVKVKLSEFSNCVRSLVASHDDFLLLASFCDCYEAECGVMNIDENGVPLEHLVTCVSDVELAQNPATGLRYLKACIGGNSKGGGDERRSEAASDSGCSSVSSCHSPPLANSSALFSRELVDLLKTFPHCTMPFNKFIPAYHHHFGRQCRVADYGYTKLIYLLEALPHVVQVVGEGARRTLTLAHKAQMRRFSADLMRVLKSLVGKQATIDQLPTLFEKITGKVFDPADYGLCYLEDLLEQLSENAVVIGNNIVSIPKREQTLEEVERTKTFATEVVELLSLAPQCSMLFNKFVPSYHHHYGHQCKVSDYGFTKLIELFEAIPDIVKVEEDPDEGGDRRLTLSLQVKLKVLGKQIATLVMLRHPKELPLVDIISCFMNQYGYALKPTTYEARNLEELMGKLNGAVYLRSSDRGPILYTVDTNKLKFVSMKVCRVFVECSNVKEMSYEEFSTAYQCLFGDYCALDTLYELSDTVHVSMRESEQRVVVALTKLQIFARNAYMLIAWYGGKLALSAFEKAYYHMYGCGLQPLNYGQYPTTAALLKALPNFFVLRQEFTGKGRMTWQMIALNAELAFVGFRLPKVPAQGETARDGRNVHFDKYDRFHGNANNSIRQNGSSSSTAAFALPERVLHAPYFDKNAPAACQVPYAKPRDFGLVNRRVIRIRDE